jgi:hypothetical protein
MRTASRSAQALAGYLWTCPHRATEGLFVLPLAYLEVDTGIGRDEALATFAELEQLGLANYDADAEAVLDRRALRDQPILKATDNRLTSAVPRALEVRSPRLLRELYLLAVEYSPPFAEKLGYACPEATHDSQDTLRTPFRGGPEGPVSKGVRRAEKSKSMSRDEDEVERSTRPRCAHCPDPWTARPASTLDDGALMELDGLPWCGCEPEPAVAS